MVWVAQQSFASGEISPSVYGLVSTQQYRSGCQTLVNALLTPTGAAKKRHGTEYVAAVTASHPAALFFYFAKGRQYVVQFVSEDDDAGDLNTAARQVRVLDAVTRAFVNVGDNNDHGPFDAFGDTTAYHHHFTASELPNVYAFQDNERIYFCHPDRPTLFMERQVGEGGVERWEYGLAMPASNTAKIVDYQVQALITRLPSNDRIESNLPLFDKRDEGGYWRLQGADPSVPNTNIYGNWFKTNTYRSATEMQGQSTYGNFGNDATDWTGPYTEAGTSFTVTTSVNTSGQNESVTATWTPGVQAFLNWVGLPVLVEDQLYIVVSVTGLGSIGLTRLEGANLVLAGSHTMKLMGLGAANGIVTNEYLDQRPYLQRHPVAPSGSTGTVNLFSSAAVFQDVVGSVDGDFAWLPDGHETTFDKFGSDAVGGTVHLNSGIIALTGVTTNNGPGNAEVVYSGEVVKTLAHVGPSMQYALGPSTAVGFPACGAPHQGRVYFGGFKEKPTRLIASRVGTRDDFVAGDLDDDAIAVDISDPLGGRISWMESSADLLIGTATAEFALGGRPVTASNLAVERQSGFGAKNVRPQLVGSAAVFVDAGGKGLREMAFVFEADRYQSPDLTDLAKHIFEDIVIEQVAYVTSPETIIYVRDTNDLMYAFSYWRANGVAGWSRFVQPAWEIDTDTDTELSTIESMTAVRADGIDITKDELWVVRRFKVGGRGGAGTAVRRIERMSADFDMDQGVRDESPTSTVGDAGVNALDYIQQPDTQVLIQENSGDDFVYIGDFETGVLGTVTYPDLGFTPNEARWGRTITFNLVPITPHGAVPVDGDTQGRLEKITTAIILLRNSRGGTAGDGVKTGSLMPPGIVLPNASDITATITAIDGWRKVVSVGVQGSLPRLEIIQTEPYHFEIGGINFMMTFGK